MAEEALEYEVQVGMRDDHIGLQLRLEPLEIPMPVGEHLIILCDLISTLIPRNPVPIRRPVKIQEIHRALTMRFRVVRPSSLLKTVLRSDFS